MCGITGVIDFNRNLTETVLNEMIQTLNHRGPDDKGIFISKLDDYFIGFAQSRLSIVDLSQGGHQPMKYKHYVVVFNGEIYNYKELKFILEEKGHQFESTSDTEVILHAFEEWGINCISSFIGMFALVIWDEKEKKVFMFRDRAGVKPFYYYWNNGTFLFSSELKSFHQNPDFQKEINLDSVYLFFDYGYISSPHCIYKYCQKLPPAHFISFDLEEKVYSIEKYWDIQPYYQKPAIDVSYEDAKIKTKYLLESACNYRMIADVPIGVFLSGGYDSTAVSAILQSSRTDRINTFTIGFEEGRNEAPFAKNTAKILGTNHHEFYCTPKQTKDIIPTLPFYFDEPFADSSAIPTILVSKMAVQHVKVALSADGGDELFAGYNSYISMLRYNEQLNRIPSYAHTLARIGIDLIQEIIPNSKLGLRHKLHGVRGALSQNRVDQLIKLNSVSKELPAYLRENLFKNINQKATFPFIITADKVRDEISALLLADTRTYLENDILTKVDRATMSVSLEGREPLLDHRLFEWIAQLPSEYKYDGKVTKKILKDIVHEYIPKKYMERPKSGFSLPIYSWLNKDLSYLLEEYLSEEALKASNVFNYRFVLELKKRFKENKLHHVTLIWKLLMFQMWYKKWMS